MACARASSTWRTRASSLLELSVLGMLCSDLPAVLPANCVATQEAMILRLLDGA
jgi:hypothetical protein